MKNLGSEMFKKKEGCGEPSRTSLKTSQKRFLPRSLKFLLKDCPKRNTVNSKLKVKKLTPHLLIQVGFRIAHLTYFTSRLTRLPAYSLNSIVPVESICSSHLFALCDSKPIRKITFSLGAILNLATKFLFYKKFGEYFSFFLRNLSTLECKQVCFYPKFAGYQPKKLWSFEQFYLNRSSLTAKDGDPQPGILFPNGGLKQTTHQRRAVLTNPAKQGAVLTKHSNVWVLPQEGAVLTNLDKQGAVF
jgi:hypothetical protein